MKRFLLLIGLVVFITLDLKAQDTFEAARISGNFQFDAQSYKKDSLIGADDVPEEVLSNAYLFLNYTLGNFSAGMRYESYQNPLLGFDSRYKGHGIAYRFIEFTSDMFDATAGNFYEQFGSGMIFRAYEDRQLGFDNAVEGVRLKMRPSEGVELTALVGKQRSFWGVGDGIVRGGDLNLDVNSIFEDLLPNSLQLNLGGSVVSKFQTDLNSFYRLPENVLAWSSRFQLIGENFSLDGEYAYKYNDPSATNNFSYNPGTGMILTGSYFGTGISFTLNLHRIDNMDFRSDRNAVGNNLNMNYLPPLTKQQAYRLTTIYPFATQIGGEAGVQAEFTYTFDRKTLFGGDYGTTISINASRVQNIDTTHIDEFTYNSPSFSIGDKLFYQDINLELNKKWSKELKTIFTFMNFTYDKDILENEGAPHYGKVYGTVLIADITYKLTSTHSIRIEAQNLWSSQDSAIVTPDNINGDWLFLFAEYTISPNWYFSVWDEYNYGNNDEDLRLHYLSVSVAYVHSSTRVSLGYGRQRGGILCVGGVCREVPSSNGFSLSVSSSF